MASARGRKYEYMVIKVEVFWQIRMKTNELKVASCINPPTSAFCSTSLLPRQVEDVRPQTNIGAVCLFIALALKFSRIRLFSVEFRSDPFCLYQRIESLRHRLNWMHRNHPCWIAMNSEVVRKEWKANCWQGWIQSYQHWFWRSRFVNQHHGKPLLT